jgi:serine/threonine-protein kinase
MNSSIGLPSLEEYRRNRQPSAQLGRLCRFNRLFRDRYKIIRPLGRGGFGVTYLAQDTVLPSEPLCVVKQLSPKTKNPKVLEKASERFEREAKTLSQLGSHSQIPRLLDYFQYDGEFYLIQEYVKGHNLAKEVKLDGPLSEKAVKQFLCEILPVLDYIHQNRVIHRDIKPPNIIRCKNDGRLVLIDFGAVREQISQTSHLGCSTATTQFVGTVGFAPPEQLALRATFASDIYSLGITCLYLLTGKPPLEFEYDPGTGEVLWQQDVELTDYFSQILSKMIKIAPCDRYTSIEELTRALELEPHLNELETCMTSQKSKQADDAEADDDYISPIVRTAQSIRTWRSRVQTRKRGKPIILNSGM